MRKRWIGLAVILLAVLAGGYYASQPRAKESGTQSPAAAGQSQTGPDRGQQDRSGSDPTSVDPGGASGSDQANSEDESGSGGSDASGINGGGEAGVGSDDGKSENHSRAALLSLSDEWPSYGNNNWQNHYSPDASLTSDSVNRLKLVYDKKLPDSAGGNETYPIEEDGILYVTTAKAEVLALHADTGKPMWTYTPQTNVADGIPEINRGIALGPQHVFVLTADDQLIALDKASGKIVFSKVVADQKNGYFESMAPLYANGKVFVGSSGGDEGARGFLAAYSAANGKQLWRFYTVPERGEGWMPKDGSHGGGAVWTTPAYDPETHVVYFGTGNPSPDYYGKARQGPNPYTDSVVALNAESGKLLWYGQEVMHDLWDYDVASPPMLFKLGSEKIVGEAGKDGMWYEWDAESGKQLTDPVAFVKEDHSPPTEKGTEEWPGPAGGANYGPSAYNPKTHLAFVAGINGPEVLKAKPVKHVGRNLDLGTGQSPAPASEWSGTVSGINAENGKLSWQIHTDTPEIGGVTANAGGLVLFGQSNVKGTLKALDADSGKLLWTQDAGAPIGTAPIIYHWQGYTYMTVVSGGAKSFKYLYPYKGPAHVLTYRLNAAQN